MLHLQQGKQHRGTANLLMASGLMDVRIIQSPVVQSLRAMPPLETGQQQAGREWPPTLMMVITAMPEVPVTAAQPEVAVCGTTMAVQEAAVVVAAMAAEVRLQQEVMEVRAAAEGPVGMIMTVDALMV
jgi:hypothetical protein